MIAASFLYALSSVNWSAQDLFISPDQQGRLLMSKKDFSGAAKVFQDSMQQGTALYRNGDFKEAAAAFGRDDSAAAIYNRVNAMVMLGKYDDAIAGYEKAVSMKPIGRRPIAAFGNSDGDLQRLQWTAAGSGKRFSLIVHHTDSKREYAYDRKSHIGRLDKALVEAKEKGWTVVDMKKDWKAIYPFEK